MQRRKAVKVLALGGLGTSLLAGNTFGSRIPPKPLENTFQSDWDQWPNLDWIGPEYWGNRLQDWKIVEGKATCVVSGKNRTLFHLGIRLSDRPQGFQCKLAFSLINQEHEESFAGLRLGVKGPFDDYRSAVVFGTGLDCGVRGDGRLFIGETVSEARINDLSKPVHTQLRAVPDAGTFSLQLEALDPVTKQVLSVVKVSGVAPGQLVGQLGLVSHAGGEAESKVQPSAEFISWEMNGEKLDYHADRQFGPVCFAYYTLHKKELRLTAQMAPVENFVNHEIHLELQRNGAWETVAQGKINRLGRVVRFVLRDWDNAREIPYRVRLDLPFSKGAKQYYYEGKVAAEPLGQAEVKMAVFSCNADHGFPDQEVSDNVGKHRPDLAVFLGDQFYEGTGGFGIETAPLERSSLDYLRKWYMFGWSYREIFRNIPCVFIPDDHDVYHGNVWGEGGKRAPVELGWNYDSQDQGGYKMPPEWVNMVQLTQTGHLPTPYDPSPLTQGIGSYYTDWVYGGISMAILEDRKFKSAPKNVLPEEAKVLNGFIQNREFDIKAHYNIDANLLGDRQMEFLEKWSEDWGDQVEMKVALSQTNFCTVATLPEGSIIDSIVPTLPIPKLGEYVQGDAPTSDMDSNGWPQKGRDNALRILRKAFALHIAGDQHLASVVRYGIDEFGDAGFAFAGPALNNLFPRRWWPPIPENHQPLEGQPKYTGNFFDGFGNRMTVHAVANPRQTNRLPARIYDRSTGYGMVVFNKKERTMRIECWPRYVDPLTNPEGQYGGWPITITQEDNYSKKALGYLPELEIDGLENPVVSVIHEDSGETEYTLRVNRSHFRPKVFRNGTYRVQVESSDAGVTKTLAGLSIDTVGTNSIRVV